MISAAGQLTSLTSISNYVTQVPTVSAVDFLPFSHSTIRTLHVATQYTFYLIDCCTPVSGCQRLRSASRHRLMVPRHRRSTFGRRAFAVAGPTVWNLLRVNLRDPAISTNNFTKSLKTWLFRRYQRTESIRMSHDDALYL